MSDEFQAAPSSKKGSANKHKRVYIGNLPKDIDSSSFSSFEQALEESLICWMKEEMPSLHVNSVQISARGKNASALIDCGPQANEVIRSFHQKEWQGRRLNVQREKRNNKKTTPTNEKKSKSNFASKTAFGGRGWSAPIAPQPAPATTFHKIPVEMATQNIKKVVEDELKEAEERGDDPINVAIASTTAASLLAAMGAFDGGNDNGTTSEDRNIMADLGNDVEYTEEDRVDEPGTFQMKPMADLLADFGQEDPNWTKIQPDDVTDVQVDEHSITNDTTNQLAPKGKAPIHVTLTSFGFTKGAPKRMDGWSHRQPLLPLDCREFPKVPNYLAWQDGLSGAVKRALQYPPRNHDQHRNDRNRRNTTHGLQETSGRRITETDDKEEKEFSLRDFARQVVAVQAWDAILDAQKDGHGYVSPLEMTIFVGSDLGRHRSVVVCEWAAIQLRKLLRKNGGDAVKQPVSVGTFHRDVEAHRQQNHNSRNNHGGNKRNTRGGRSDQQQQHQGKTLMKKSMEMAGDW